MPRALRGWHVDFHGGQPDGPRRELAARPSVAVSASDFAPAKADVHGLGPWQARLHWQGTSSAAMNASIR